MNPSSHIKYTLFGKVNRFPIEEPLIGARKEPQSFAERKSHETNVKCYIHSND